VEADDRQLDIYQRGCRPFTTHKIFENGHMSLQPYTWVIAVRNRPHDRIGNGYYIAELR
jgi:hypothetical protein